MSLSPDGNGLFSYGNTRATRLLPEKETHRRAGAALPLCQGSTAKPKAPSTPETGVLQQGLCILAIIHQLLPFQQVVTLRLPKERNGYSSVIGRVQQTKVLEKTLCLSEKSSPCYRFILMINLLVCILRILISCLHKGNNISFKMEPLLQHSSHSGVLISIPHVRINQSGFISRLAKGGLLHVSSEIMFRSRNSISTQSKTDLTSGVARALLTCDIFC